MSASTFTAYYVVENTNLISNPLFNAMGLSLSTAITGASLVRTSGPTWGSQPSPQGGLGLPQLIPNTFATEVYRFDDALQGTYPVYVRIEYTAVWTNSDYAQPGFYITIGLDAAFVRQGPRMLFINWSYIGTGDNRPANFFLTEPQNCYVSGATNRLHLALFQGPDILSGFFLNVERTKDTSGNDTNEGVIVQAVSVAPGCSGDTNYPEAFRVLDQVIPYNITVAGYNRTMIAAFPQNAASMDLADVIGISEIVPFNFRPYNPGVGALLYMNSDFAPYTTQTIPMYGTNHTYLPFPDLSFPSQLTTPSSACNLAMRYD